MKRPRPQDARRELRAVWSSARVYSCADGSLRVIPTWRKRYSQPGVLTRMACAYAVESVLGLPVGPSAQKRATAAVRSHEREFGDE